MKEDFSSEFPKGARMASLRCKCETARECSNFKPTLFPELDEKWFSCEWLDKTGLSVCWYSVHNPV